MQTEKVQPGATIPDRGFFHHEVQAFAAGQLAEPVVYDSGCAGESRAALEELRRIRPYGRSLAAYLNDSKEGRVVIYSHLHGPKDNTTVLTLHPGAAVVYSPCDHALTDLKHLGVSL